MSTSDTRMVVAVDPGAERTGIATRWPDGAVTCSTHGRWGAMTEIMVLIAAVAGDVSAIVVERWIPYAGKGSNVYREMTEAKILGAIEWECQQLGIPYVEQGADLLRPTRAIADAHGYEWQAEDRDQKAAEAHLYHYLHLRRET